jgi:hypothetical protein
LYGYKTTSHVNALVNHANRTIGLTDIFVLGLVLATFVAAALRLSLLAIKAYKQIIFRSPIQGRQKQPTAT